MREDGDLSNGQHRENFDDVYRGRADDMAIAIVIAMVAMMSIMKAMPMEGNACGDANDCNIF